MRSAAGHRLATLPTPKREEHDVATHVDLGIMEKTMERYDVAIEHFKAVMEDPKREVFALSMIGECSEALGDSAEAIRCYQDALKRPTATRRRGHRSSTSSSATSSTTLATTARRSTTSSVSYKRDPNFRDIASRLADVKSRAASR